MLKTFLIQYRTSPPTHTVWTCTIADGADTQPGREPTYDNTVLQAKTYSVNDSMLDFLHRVEDVDDGIPQSPAYEEPGVVLKSKSGELRDIIPGEYLHNAPRGFGCADASALSAINLTVAPPALCENDHVDDNHDNHDSEGVPPLPCLSETFGDSDGWESSFGGETTTDGEYLETSLNGSMFAIGRTHYPSAKDAPARTARRPQQTHALLPPIPPPRPSMLRSVDAPTLPSQPSAIIPSASVGSSGSPRVMHSSDARATNTAAVRRTALSRLAQHSAGASSGSEHARQSEL